ncbi:hypothetical protein CRYUN_Cryun32bG0019900 [Craigia yunnanensis]
MSTSTLLNLSIKPHLLPKHPQLNSSQFPLIDTVMRLLTILFSLSATIAIFAATSLADFDEKPHIQTEQAPSEIQEQTSLRGLSRFLAQQNLKPKLTCDKFPRICRLKNSSPGPDCCKKKCVNVKKDRLNCGMCGYKCKYTKICCKGQCVNASFDKRNCGGCNKKCKKGEFCVYGMCNYA